MWPLVCLLFLYLYPVNAWNRVGHAVEADLKLTIGTPPQTLGLRFSTKFSGVLVVNSACGRARAGCPHFCRVEAFDDAFCPFDCQFGMNAEYWRQRCEFVKKMKGLNFFAPPNSSSIVESRKEWRGGETRAFARIGQWLRDTMEFSIYDSLQERQVTLENGTFVDVWQFDPSFIDETREIAVDGYLGLAPGKGNLIVQLFAQRLIPAPIATFSAAGESFLKVGGLPTECEQWAFHSTLTNSWVFRAERVEIFGFVFRNQTIQMDFLNDARFYVPDEVVGSMLASGVLTQGSEVQGDVQYYIDCNETFELSAQVDGQRFLIDLKWLPWPEKCLTIVRPFRSYWNERNYVDTPAFGFGRAFFVQYCAAFDYATNRLALGALRTE